ncbi:hypothetical protein PGB90_009775 [Kerria lacca]
MRGGMVSRNLERWFVLFLLLQEGKSVPRFGMKRDSIKIKEMKMLSRRKFNFSGRLLEPMVKGDTP